GTAPADEAAIQAAGGNALPLIASEVEATIAAEAFTAAQAAAFALGLRLRAYRFDRYRTKEAAEDKPKLTRVTITTPDIPAAQAAHAPLSAVADGVCLTRDLVSEPANILYPAEMADRCRALEKLGVKVEIL